MGFLAKRIIRNAIRFSGGARNAAPDDGPEAILLPVQANVSASDKPPVRIYLGTEPAQYRAERIFIWSIMQVRDPSRVYEIYLMKNLPGFRKTYWTTGFTNYRFAIPHFCGAAGRAIYNDVDQVYLRDPAELFDLPLGEHGYLAISSGDISVALLDCERMARVWSLEDARKRSKNNLLARAAKMPGLWGELDGRWNARDDEFQPDNPGVVHFTTLHRQPWQPFPQEFVYQENPVGEVWFSLERSANAAGFCEFSADQPSREFRHLQKQVASLEEPGDHSSDRGSGRSGGLPDEWAAGIEADNLLLCRIRKLAVRPPEFGPDGDVRLSGEVQIHDPISDAVLSGPSPGFDAVVCAGVLEFVPDEDVPWILEDLFSRSDGLLECHVDERGKQPSVNHAHAPIPRKRDTGWWQYQFETIAPRFPGVHWRLWRTEPGWKRGGKRLLLEGNECLRRPVRVWLLESAPASANCQARALAAAVGWSYETKYIAEPEGRPGRALSRLFPMKLNQIHAPWPDVVFAAGRRPVQLARAIGRRSSGRARLVLAGRRCGPLRGGTEIQVICRFDRLSLHDRRIKTLLPPVMADLCNGQSGIADHNFIERNGKSPKILLLVGDGTDQYTLRRQDAENLAREVLDWTTASDGFLHVIVTGTTSEAAMSGLREGLAGRALLERQELRARSRVWRDCLAAADILVVTGGCQLLLSQAVASGKTVYIYPLRPGRLSPAQQLGDWLLRRATQKPANRRGTERPQQGLEYLCARLLQREWVLPPRDIEGLHRELVRLGLARMFGEPFRDTKSPGSDHAGSLGERIRMMLQQPAHEPAPRVNECSSTIGGSRLPEQKIDAVF